MLEFGLREWLLLLGPVVIAVVLGQGYWRMRRDPNRIGVELDKRFLSQPGEKVQIDENELVRGELPNGGARVVKSNGARMAELFAGQQQETVKPDLEQDLQVLMDPVEVPEADGSQLSLPMIPEPPPGRVNKKKAAAPKSKPAAPAPARPAPARPAPAARPAAAAGAAAPAASTAPAQTPRPAAAGSESRLPVRPEMLVIMSVVTENVESPFKGKVLQELFAREGLTLGDRQIYHYHDKDTREILFSLVNAVEPGSFDPATMAEMETPGLSLFTKIHGVLNPCAAHERMIAVASNLTRELDGVLLDQEHNPMTPQALAGDRQRVKDYVSKYPPLTR